MPHASSDLGTSDALAWQRPSRPHRGRRSKDMKSPYWLIGALVWSVMASFPSAQTETKANAPVTRQVSGEVLKVDGFNLVVKMIPGGDVRTFNAQPGRTAIIDGETVSLD